MNDFNFENECDHIDASVFSGDALVDPENRKEFKSYLDRWYRELKVFEDTFSEIEEGLTNLNTD